MKTGNLYEKEFVAFFRFDEQRKTVLRAAFSTSHDKKKCRCNCSPEVYTFSIYLDVRIAKGCRNGSGDHPDLGDRGPHHCGPDHRARAHRPAEAHGGDAGRTGKPHRKNLRT